MKIRIKLYDELNYLMHISEVEHPLKKFYTWGELAFEKVGNRRYRQITFGVIHDTRRGEFKTSQGENDG